MIVDDTYSLRKRGANQLLDLLLDPDDVVALLDELLLDDRTAELPELLLFVVDLTVDRLFEVDRELLLFSTVFALCVPTRFTTDRAVLTALSLR